MKNVDYFDERERSVGYPKGYAERYALALAPRDATLGANPLGRAERNRTTKTMMMLNAMRSLWFNLGTSDVFD